jgi:hypothetical protein
MDRLLKKQRDVWIVHYLARIKNPAILKEQASHYLPEISSDFSKEIVRGLLGEEVDEEIQSRIAALREFSKRDKGRKRKR